LGLQFLKLESHLAEFRQFLTQDAHGVSVHSSECVQNKHHALMKLVYHLLLHLADLLEHGGERTGGLQLADGERGAGCKPG
jgi:hypothetical protein